jgi:DNA repair protein SbcC/Rad50
MIKAIDIQNFQSHAHTRCEFHPGVNVIIGSSDAGKTAIIRALRWVIWNRPSGPTVQSHWGGETKVVIETEDAVTITRIKGKSDSYISHVTGEEDLEFKAFGTSVPQEIIQLLNINEINLQRQLDAPFLLSETSGNVAKHFNKIAKLDEIDIATSRIKSVITSTTGVLKYDRETLKSKKEELEKYAHLETAEIRLEVLEGFVTELVSLKSTEKKLNILIDTVEKAKEDIKTWQPILDLEGKVNQLISWQEKQEALSEDLTRLNDLIKQIEKCNNRIKRQQQKIALEDRVKALLLLYENKESEEDRISRLNAEITLLGSKQVLLTTETEKEVRLREKYNRLFPNICPWCGNTVKKS